MLRISFYHISRKISGYSVWVWLLLITGCSVSPLHYSVPKEQLEQVVIQGFDKSIRFWADEAPSHLSEAIIKRIDDYLIAQENYYNVHGFYPPLHYLALSGGAYDGAYGAGFLYGWTQKGSRPEFAIVTGVSTGALIAPFAFLGPEYDETLKTLFTATDSRSIFDADLSSVISGLTGGLALTDNTPLATRIREAITPEIMREIASRHALGYRLFIGTTNLEAQRGVIWNIGEIASSGHTNALPLIHDIILASASVPGLFEPVFIDVTKENEFFSEIHMDGGVTFNVFIYPLKIDRSVIDAFLERDLKRHLYIIRNSKITPEYTTIEPGFFSLSRRSIETLTKAQGIGDLYRLYIAAERDELDYNLTYIPDDFIAKPQELFDPEYMSALFEVGRQQVQQPSPWLKKPPGVEYADSIDNAKK